MSSSKPSTPILQRRYGEQHEYNGTSRIPISLSPIPFRRTNSMRLRPNCSLYNTTLNETTLKQHNKNFLQARNSVCSDRVQQLRLINLQRTRRGSLSMEDPKYEGCGDPGGTSKTVVDNCSAVNMKHMNGGDSTRKNGHGMVSLVKI